MNDGEILIHASDPDEFDRLMKGIETRPRPECPTCAENQGIIKLQLSRISQLQGTIDGWAEGHISNFQDWLEHDPDIPLSLVSEGTLADQCLNLARYWENMGCPRRN